MQSVRTTDAPKGIVGAVLHYASGAEVFGAGDAAESIFKVVSGVVRSCSYQNDGRRLIHGFHAGGEVFGFDAGARHSLSAEAVGDCTLIAYRRRRLEKFAATDEGFSLRLLSYALQSLAKAESHSRLLGHRSALGKIAAFLVERADCSANRSIIDLAMTRQDIADYLALTIETVSRTFHLLETENLIALQTSRRVHLKDLARLRGLDS